jgi:glutathione S-transferase
MEPSMKLYGFPPSPNTWKVRALAAHLGIRLDFELVDLTKGASRTPAYLALNPTGRTPTLVDGAFKLWESTAILQYLAGKVPNSLWPDDARTRADITRWQSWGLAHWSKEGCEPLLFQRLVKKVLNLGPPDEAAIAKGLEAFHREAKVLDAHLAQQPYLVGKDITIADFSIAAPLFHAKAADMPIGPYARLQDWFGRVSALPCWRETAPQVPAAAA